MARSIVDWSKKNKWLAALLAAIALSGCTPHAPGGSKAPEAVLDDPSGPSNTSQEQDAAGFPPAEEIQAAPAPEAPSSVAPERAAVDLDAGDGALDEESPSPAPPPRAGASAQKRAESGRSRPGLGTVWGEDRTSEIRHTSFLRAEPSRPFALATLFYNDRAGIKAMARESALTDHGDGGFDVLGGAVSVRLLDSRGRSLPAFEVASRDYVLGEHGQSYTIQLQNHTSQRIEAVATVDGLDVVDGEPGSFSKRGYVIGPFDTLEIDGFRRSMDTVAQFRFGSVRNSYAAHKGKARNVGVIGVAFFHERGSESPWTRGEVERRHTADPFPERFAAPPSR